MFGDFCSLSQRLPCHHLVIRRGPVGFGKYRAISVHVGASWGTKWHVGTIMVCFARIRAGAVGTDSKNYCPSECRAREGEVGGLHPYLLGSATENPYRLAKLTELTLGTERSLAQSIFFGSWLHLLPRRRYWIHARDRQNLVSRLFPSNHPSPAPWFSFSRACTRTIQTSTPLRWPTSTGIRTHMPSTCFPPTH